MEAEAEKIIDKRTNHCGKIEYLVKWQGYPDSENTWEPSQLVCSELIEEYENHSCCVLLWNHSNQNLIKYDTYNNLKIRIVVIFGQTVPIFDSWNKKAGTTIVIKFHNVYALMLFWFELTSIQIRTTSARKDCCDETHLLCSRPAS